MCILCDSTITGSWQKILYVPAIGNPSTFLKQSFSVVFEKRFTVRKVMLVKCIAGTPASASRSHPYCVV
jgi:hypothetical protein